MRTNSPGCCTSVWKGMPASFSTCCLVFFGRGVILIMMYVSVYIHICRRASQSLKNIGGLFHCLLPWARTWRSCAAGAPGMCGTCAGGGVKRMNARPQVIVSSAWGPNPQDHQRRARRTTELRTRRGRDPGPCSRSGARRAGGWSTTTWAGRSGGS